MNEIIAEIKLMEQVMGRDFTPKPTYLYLQGYGKDLKNEIQELAKATDSKNALIFDKLQCNPNRSLIDDFKVLLERNKSIGQSYEGLVLIDLNGLEQKDIFDFVEYLSGNAGNKKYIFTIQDVDRDLEDVNENEDIKKLLEKYFFIRTVEATPYSAEEQYGVICESFMEHQKNGIQIDITDDSEYYMLEFLEKKKWQSDEIVLFQLKKLVASAVYEYLISKKTKQLTIDQEFASRMLEKLEVKPKEKRKIGFSIGGPEYE